MNSIVGPTSAREFLRLPLLSGLTTFVGVIASILRIGFSISMVCKVQQKTSRLRRKLTNTTECYCGSHVHVKTIGSELLGWR
jgi:hypothetical protein